MALLDALFIIAAILIIIWLVGLVAFSVGPIIYVLLIIAAIIIIVRLASGRRV